MVMNMNLGEKIKKMRIGQGLTQAELAKRIGTTNRAVSKWENGLSYPSYPNLVRLSHTLGLSQEIYTEGKKQTEKPTGMRSLRELYKAGCGPSSSHTMGPEKICLYAREKYSRADAFSVTLYGSLAKTGMGHGTDRVIRRILGENTAIHPDYETQKVHPNTMEITAWKDNTAVGSVRACSVGGGDIEIEGALQPPIYVYEHTSFARIAAYCRQHAMPLYAYAEEREGRGLTAYLLDMWKTMQSCIRRGLSAEGILPGGLGIERKAKYLYGQHHMDESAQTKENRIVCAYAFAVGEENAAGGRVVTAPTCGAAGVVPAVLYYFREKNGFRDEDIIHAMETGGIIGNLIKTNASISGAECGCQAEIGSACAMAAAALGELLHLTVDQIEYAAEIALEHHLGLTCDPVCGLVQIPCIERNAVAAMRAINAVTLANFLSETRKISLDSVIRTMKETGDDISGRYKETGEGGLAKNWHTEM